MSNNKGKHQGKLDTLCQLPPDIPAIKSYLKELDTQAQHVAANSNDYPKQTISADVWRDGYQIVNTARALAEWLEQQRLYELLPQAIECWGTAAFAVVSHYRAEIGPFMHAVMRLQKRRGNSQAVQEACRAILGRFHPPAGGRRRAARRRLHRPGRLSGIQRTGRHLLPRPRRPPPRRTRRQRSPSHPPTPQPPAAILGNPEALVAKAT